MKKKYLIFLLIFLPIINYSQEIQTLFSKDSLKTNTLGAYGGPFLKHTRINKEMGIIIGGEGGLIINKQFTIGGLGMGMINQPSIRKDSSGHLTLNLGAGGIFAEYILKLRNKVHFSIPFNLMIGGVLINEEYTKKRIESSSIFIFEPGVNVEFNLTNNFITAINISYRKVVGTSLINLNNQDLSGINIGLIFKFGHF